MPVASSNWCSVPVVKNHHRDWFERSTSASESSGECLVLSAADGQSRFGRFRLRPEAGTEFLSPEQAKEKTADFLAAEMSERLARGPVEFRVFVQVADDGDVSHEDE
jgi:catalase